MTRPAFRLHGDDAVDLVPGCWLLEASAGTGKTYTIVGILLRLILEQGLPIERCVVMTFTRAATAELRERIRRGLHQALLVLDDPALPDDPFFAWLQARHRADAVARKRLLLALAALDAALVATIHGVCNRLLGDHALQVAAPLGAELDAELEGWRLATINDLLRQWNRALDGDCIGLVAAALDPQAVASACRQLESHPAVRFDGVEVMEAAGLRAEVAGARAAWPTWRPAIAAFFAEHQADFGRSRSHSVERVAATLAAIDAALAGPIDHAALASACAPILSHANLRTYLPAAVFAALREQPWHVGLSRLLSAPHGVRRALLEAYRTRLGGRIAEAETLHYNDLLTALAAALDGPQADTLRAAVGARYDLVLVDEFQDTDPLQWQILAGLFLARGKHLFLIGDPKQAIYAFRGADVHAYLAVAERDDLRPFTLDRNFRSDEDLVHAVNRVFDRGPRAFIEKGIAFAPVTAAKPCRLRGVADPRPFQFWWQEPLAAAVDTRRALAAACAAEISRLLATAEIDAQGWRPCRAGDIAVLVRSHSEGSLIAEALARLDQPIASVRNMRESVFASRCAFELHVLLRAVLAPQRERYLRAAALTRLCGLGPDDLLGDEPTPAYEALRLRLRALRDRWLERGFVAAWQDFLDQGCGLDSPRVLLAAAPDGERSLTDLLHLGDLLSAAESDGRLGPEALLDLMQTRIAAGSGGGEEQLLRIDRDDAAVRILTIHTSKGLQFPVVFTPFLWSSRQEGADQIYHRQNQACWFLGDQRPAAVERQQLRETMAEDLRLAYVALTRAEHRCYCCFAPQAPRAGGAGCTRSALSWLLAGVTDGKPEEMVAALDAQTLGDPTWAQRLRAALAHPAIAVCDTPEPIAQARPPETAVEAAAARPVAAFAEHRRLRWFSSYSGLIRNRPVDEPDHDQLHTDLPGDERLPRGARFGTALHAVFELVDFAASRPAVEQCCREQLLAHGFNAGLVPALADMVEQTLATRLPDSDLPLRLAAASRLPELEVLLPVSEPHAIAAAFAEHGGEWRDYARHLEGIVIPGGYFTGIIDLVFQVDGRFHLLDWKSNDLAKRGGYHREAMAAEMLHHHYVLQYHLYAVALHRFLRLRLRDYDIARHLGEAHYVFTRGIDGAGAGWYCNRPSDAMILALDACFGAMP